jgi:hypothetical protein
MGDFNRLLVYLNQSSTLTWPEEVYSTQLITIHDGSSIVTSGHAAHIGLNDVACS